ncbi:peptidoglycan bridge formation protein FemAB [Candidatus Shapirobacteria bacterium CG03_land_8_20_14_0_80_39_12]|uniref:Peptidoglycan bridge formation protein FemAB n=1 Tax=Candidatus Shapirobacteria bacterium CG03_land_8_20_14_0_80_39_12 TaxID=1974879 RepID=A0A2M7BCZ6_9BACT|nr:MAG: peptidoglycan bridge formation protein FemAB [Candidatus Shapirobacteria bacterium CG03_land_8_20_14_0_80_39_12]
MEEIKILKEQPENYNELATHPLQSWQWGEFRKDQGVAVVRLGIFQKAKLMQVFQITFHQIPHLPFSIGYLPKSSLPSKEVINKLKEIGQEKKAIFIKIEPNTEKSEIRNSKSETLGLIKGKPLFTKYTSVIDLTKIEEELLKSFKPKTRYNIHLAEKHGVSVREDNSEKAFVEYLKLLFETTKRQGFYAHNEKYHQKQWEILKDAGISHLLTAAHEGKTLSAFLLFVFNKTLYYPYGASTRENRELMAPTLLMWEAIRFGKKMGCTSFDLWGDIGPNPSPDNPYFGFHKFKEGFSPKLTEFLGTYDLVINPGLYQLYKISDSLRWKFLHLKSKF